MLQHRVLNRECSPSGAVFSSVGASQCRATVLARKLTPACAPLHKLQVLPGSCSHMGSSVGCRMDWCSSVFLQMQQGHNLLCHCLLHRTSGNLCFHAWSTSSPSFNYLDIYRAAPLRSLSSLTAAQCLLGFLKYDRRTYNIVDCLWAEMDPSWSQLKLSRCNMVTAAALTEATPAICPTSHKSSTINSIYA